jgi:hypothetical protein
MAFYSIFFGLSFVQNNIDTQIHTYILRSNAYCRRALTFTCCALRFDSKVSEVLCEKKMNASVQMNYIRVCQWTEHN